MSLENTFPGIVLKIMFITSIRQYFKSRDGIVLDICDDCELKFIQIRITIIFIKPPREINGL